MRLTARQSAPLSSGLDLFLEGEPVGRVSKRFLGRGREVRHWLGDRHLALRPRNFTAQRWVLLEEPSQSVLLEAQPMNLGSSRWRVESPQDGVLEFRPTDFLARRWSARRLDAEVPTAEVSTRRLLGPGWSARSLEPLSSDCLLFLGLLRANFVQSRLSVVAGLLNPFPG